jgi:hypothetical protein
VSRGPVPPDVPPRYAVRVLGWCNQELADSFAAHLLSSGLPPGMTIEVGQVCRDCDADAVPDLETCERHTRPELRR